MVARLAHLFCPPPYAVLVDIKCTANNSGDEDVLFLLNFYRLQGPSSSSHSPLGLGSKRGTTNKQR